MGQTSIVLFSMVGGLLAFLLVTVNANSNATRLQNPPASNSTTTNQTSAASSSNTSLNDFIAVVSEKKAEGFWKTFFSSEGILAFGKVIVSAFGAAILAAAFTVVSSRLSDTHFPINITVQDAWGAITVGFISYFIGGKFIQWLQTFASGGGGTGQTPTGRPSGHPDNGNHQGDGQVGTAQANTQANPTQADTV
jgi:hypothetical protein